MNDLPNPGDVLVVPWPFMRDQEAIDENKRREDHRSRYAVDPYPYELRAWEWKPGMRIERDHDYGGRFEEWTECHGMGGKVLKAKTLKRWRNVEKGRTADYWDVEVDEYAVSKAFGTRVIECDKCGRPKQAKGDEDAWTCGICSIGERWVPPRDATSVALEGKG